MLISEAVVSGVTDLLVWLLEYAKQTLEDQVFESLLEDRNEDGLTPLFCAAISGNLAAFQALNTNGADVTATDNVGKTALHHVVQGIHTYMIEEIIKKNSKKKY